MKQFKLLMPLMGYEIGTMFFGPLPIAGQSALGYYTEEAKASAPSTECLFQSAVENNPTQFSEIKQQETKASA